MKRIQFNTTFFDGGVPKYQSGKHYPVTEETKRQVILSIAEEIDVEDPEVADAEKQKAEDEAKQKAEDAEKQKAEDEAKQKALDDAQLAVTAAEAAINAEPDEAKLPDLHSAFAAAKEALSALLS